MLGWLPFISPPRRGDLAPMLRVPAGFARLPDGRRAWVPGFWLDERPVTNGDWRRYQRATGAESPPWILRVGWDDPDQPVVGVTLGEARAFARWARKRLPREAEWARACGREVFPWGPEQPTRRRAVYALGAGAPPERAVCDEGRGPYGHLDLVGNNWELVAEGLGCGGFRGSEEPTVSLRVTLGQDERSGGVGFRCAWR